VLRRTERIVLREDDEETPEATFVAEPALATGPIPDRRNLEQWLNEVEKAGEKQRAEKKGLDALRAEVQRTLVTSDGEVISSTGTVWRAMLKPSRLALLAVALVAGGVAAYFATTMDQGTPVISAPVPEVAQPVAQPAPPPPAPMTQILVATRALAMGARLTPQTVEWKNWPADAMRDDYITNEAQPAALDEMAGSIVRFEFFPGEPIRVQKLASPGDGYLSAVLEPGEVGVSIPVQADVAAGGFIQPNDHVDVLLTQPVGGRQVAQTVLSNVRVLAIAHRLGEVGPAPAESSDNPDEPADAGMAPATFSDGVIATLALDSDQARIITSARNSGALSLVLRSITDFSAPKSADSEALSANQQIRLTSPFWTN
jgi:pilus assembly protein CpaB